MTIRRHCPDTGFHDVPYSREAGRLLDDKACIFWIDAENPSAEDLEWVRQQFEIHPIAMEDYGSAQERSRIDRYPGFYSLVIFALSFDDRGDLRERPMTLFVGPRFIVTLHEDPFPEVREAKEQWERNEEGMECEVGVALYYLLDTLVDDYFPLIDRLADEVEDVEDQVLSTGHPTDLDRIFRLKRRLIFIRRAVAPERDVMNVLLRRELPLFSERSLIYFQDVYDHLVRVLDSLDTHRDLLAGALDLYVSVISNRLAESANRLNQTMQTLTSWSIILMAVGVIAGVYGMNFKGMPELEWRYGYPAALGLMVGVSALLLAYFRRRRWL